MHHQKFKQSEAWQVIAGIFRDQQSETCQPAANFLPDKRTDAAYPAAATFLDRPPRRLFTLKAFAERHASFLTLPALTNQVFKAKPRESTKGTIPGNGLEEAGAIVRLAGRVLIDEDGYFRWIDVLQNGGS